MPDVLGRFLDPEPVRTGLRRAGVHMARAAYEVAAGVGVFVEEIVSGILDDESGDEETSEVIRIELE